VKLRSQVTTDELKGMLRSAGIKPSIQRLQILKYLIQKRNHPSVVTIYQDLIGQIPHLSKTTVYNTLNLLTEKNIVTALSINTKELIFDFIVKPHSHFRCYQCDKIYDVHLKKSLNNEYLIQDHEIHEVQINLVGVCKECLKTTG
jgi:Fe2+ or Zn2+ uptake regulation protein